MLESAKKIVAATAAQKEVATFLYDAFSDEASAMSGLDRWTQRRVTDENLAKLALVFEADDPVEYCYQNLLRELGTEAETGIYRVSPAAANSELRELARDPGLSGKLRLEMHKIAPAIFADELDHSNAGMDLVWVTIEARYDRAKLDASVSEIIMRHISDDENSVADMIMALRSLLYSFREDRARRISGLPSFLSDRATRELMTMIDDLTERGGDFEQRVKDIAVRTGIAWTTPPGQSSHQVTIRSAT